MKEGEREKIKVGVGVMVFKDGKVLIGKRKGSHGSGDYSFTGGHLEYEESFKDCADRETLEEAGITIQNLNFLCLVNYSKYENRQDLLIGMTADWKDGEVRTDVKGKVEKWNWYSLDNLPSPIFYPAEIMIESYKTGKNYYDKE